MEELKNLRHGNENERLLCKHLLRTGPYSKHFIRINSLPNSPVKQMAVILILQMVTLSTETFRSLARVTQLGSGRAGICIQASSLQGFALYDLLGSYLLHQTTDRAVFLGGAWFESAREKI